MNHVVLIGHGKMGSALAKGWIHKNSKFKISIIEKEELLSSIGKVSFVSNEEQIDLITAISGSGPAYFFYLTEDLTEIAIDLGISKDDAINFAKNTFIGSAILLDSEKSNNATSLRKNVTSPGGTTEAALKILMNEDEGLKIILKKAVLNAINRAHELKN